MTARRLTGLWALLLIAAPLAGRGRPAYAACNLIPTTERSFASTTGEVSTPFASPGATVTVRRRDAFAFAQPPASNSITLEFHPPSGASTVLPVEPIAPPTDDDACTCAPGGCRCVSFVFPDTDTLVGGPNDRHGLTGPVGIVVKTAGKVTAQIDDLFLAGTSTRNDVPSFVALPPPNSVEAMGPASDILAAPDGAGNLLVPFDFGPLLGSPAGALLGSPAGALLAPTILRRRLQTRFVDVTVPTLNTIGAVKIDAFTQDGRQLPPLLRQVAPGGTPSDEVIGTVDFPRSVLRVEGDIGATGLQQQDGKGPIVVPGVAAASSLRNRADVLSLRSTGRFVVYENRECEHVDDPPALCMDLNGDGDTRDYFLFALDLSQPGAQPIIIDQVDGAEFPGYPTQFPPATLYNFVVTEKLVAFQIQETTGTDINGDGKPDVARSGAFDLTRGSQIPAAANSPRLEIDDGLLAFAVRDPTTDEDVLYFYDADRTDPGPFVVKDDTHPQFFLDRPSGELGKIFFSALSSCDLSQAIACSVSGSLCSPFVGAATCNIFDLAVSSGRIAFVVEGFKPENECGEEFGTLRLFVFEPKTGKVTDLDQATFCGGIRMSPRWIAFWERSEGAGVLAVGLHDFDDPEARRSICDEPLSFGVPPPSISDSIIPCAILENPNPFLITDFIFPTMDRNGDGDTNDLVLHVFLPDAPGGPVEESLFLAVNTTITSMGRPLPAGNPPVVEGNTMLIGVDEQQQGNMDLNGDGIVGGQNLVLSELPPAALFTFNAASRSRTADPVTHSEARALRNQSVATSLPPLVQFIDGGASVILPQLQRNLLRDLDGDGAFEEETTILDPVTGQYRLDDNCPFVYNPGQEDSDGDGIGDACETLDSVAHGIATLADRVEHEVGSASLRGNLVHVLERRVLANVLRAKGLADSGRVDRAQLALEHAQRGLSKFIQRLNGIRGRHLVPRGVAGPLAEEASAIGKAIGTQAGTL